MSDNSCGGGGCASCVCSADDTPAPVNGTGIGASYRFGVIGLTSDEWGIPLHNAVQIDAIVPDSPAHNAGLMERDSIVKIDDTAFEVNDEKVLTQVIALIMGAESTAVKLTIQRVEDGQWVEREVTIVRGAVSTPDPAQAADIEPEATKRLELRTKCRVCPFSDEQQPFKCSDCPNPFAVARAQARALVAAKDSWIEQILERSKPVPINGSDFNAIAYVEARSAFRNARRAVEDAGNKLDRVKAWFTLAIARLRMRKATRVIDRGVRSEPD